MKPASAALIALLAPDGTAKKLVRADLYTWTLVDGTVARFTSADRDVTISGTTWSSTNALFKRGKTRSVLGLEVDTLEVKVAPRPGDLIGGVPWIQAIVNGALDGARLLVEKFLSDSWTNTAVGKIYQFEGRVAAIDVDRSVASVKVKSDLNLLNIQLPRNLYQATCVHALYDAGCTLLKGTFTSTGVVAAGSTTSAIKTNLAQADNYFNLGVITFTSGPLSGVMRAVDSYLNANGLVSVALPLRSAPAAGVTFSIYPGCNKLFSGDCLAKFANQSNFKGTPFVPAAETAYVFLLSCSLLLADHVSRAWSYIC